MKIFNTLSKQLEEFIPVEPDKVNMYVCGPTVYDNAHLGHARCYITWDVLYRYLKYKGYDVKYCRNVTDVDDKILKKADKESKKPEEIAKRYYDSFSKTMQKLNVLKPDCEPFATETIPEMIEIIKKLIENGHAYEIEGDVYFRVKSYNKYGELSKQPIDDLLAGARVDADERKESPLDFALWKKDEKHGYESPWGLGRPGWHIECSAMSKKHLCEQIDIHAGGSDLIFPHHENERAQSECANECSFVKYWMHNGFVTINKEKMSKSLNNFITVDDVLEDYDSNTLRFFILTNHYRMPVEFSPDALESARAGVKRVHNCVEEALNFIDEENVLKEVELPKEFDEGMDDDLNTSKALAVVFSLVSECNKAVAEKDFYKTQNSLSQIISICDILGIKFKKEKVSEKVLREKLAQVYNEFGYDEEADPVGVIQALIIARANARKDKDFTKADLVRNKLDEAGILIKDTKDGTVWELK